MFQAIGILLNEFLYDGMVAPVQLLNRSVEDKLSLVQQCNTVGNLLGAVGQSQSAHRGDQTPNGYCDSM